MKSIRKISLLSLTALLLSSCDLSGLIPSSFPFPGSSSKSDDASSISGDTSLDSDSSDSESELDPSAGTITFLSASFLGVDYQSENLPVESISRSGSVSSGDDESCIRFGSSRQAGEATITFSEPIVLAGITVSAASYGSDINCGMRVTTEAHGKDETATVNGSKKDYFFDAFAEDGEVSSLTIGSTSKNKRIYLFSVTLNIGSIEPVYPTSIKATNSMEIADGASKTIAVTFSPSNTNVKELAFSSDNTGVATVDSNGKVSGVGIGETDIRIVVAAANSTTISAVTHVSVVEAPPLAKTQMATTYNDYQHENIYSLDGCPTEGEAKLLVIPIWFNNSSSFINQSSRENVRSDIQKAYFGSTSETGWHSVKSFYEEESKGRLTLTGTVAPWYEIDEACTSYGSESTGANKTMDLVETAVNAYFANNPSESRRDYDKDGNGYLDGVMLIYAAPDYDAWNKSSSSYGNLWAYCYWLSPSSGANVNSPVPNTYFWASYDFMYDSSLARTRTGNKSTYASGDVSHCNIDAHTFIHEMGHVFGLEDYYDYGTGYSPAGGFSMQDYNRGAHDAYSVMAFGWADPYIPTTSCSIQISSFQKNHDLILLTPSWNDLDSPFDEYLLLELYTPTGLNELDAAYAYDGRLQGPTNTGIRLWHVDARLAYCNSVSNSYYGATPSWSANQLTNDVTAGTYGVYHAFSNTYNNANYGSVLGSSYYNYNILELIRNSTTASTPTSSDITGSDLFGNGSSFSMSRYSRQFVRGSKLNSNVDLGWSFTVSISGSGENAVATVNLVKA